jgi:hypothetical protein
MGKVQMHQATGGVVNINQQGTSRCAVLKPAVVAAVDLDQFADTVTPVARLIDRRRTQRPGNPQASFAHELAHRFLAKDDPMDLAQLLACQRRSKVGISGRG